MVSPFWKAYVHNISETQRETTLTPINAVNTSARKPQKAATTEGDFSELRDLDEATQTTTHVSHVRNNGAYLKGLTWNK